MTTKFVREKIFGHRSKFLSQKIPSQKQVSVTKKFLSQKQVSITESSLVLMLVLFNERFFKKLIVFGSELLPPFLLSSSFFSQQSERITFADLINVFWEHFFYGCSLCANTFSWKSKTLTHFNHNCDLSGPWLKISMILLINILQMSPSEQVYHFRWRRSRFLKTRIFENWTTSEQTNFFKRKNCFENVVSICGKVA